MRNKTDMQTFGSRRNGLALATGGALLALLALTGCDDVYTVTYHCDGVHAPVGVYSVTGDEAVALYWYPVEEHDVDEYVVYRSTSAYGDYYEVGHTSRDYFVDRDLRNGRTYYYAVSAVDPCGNESELSRELVHDTPRPEGFDARLYDANGDDWPRSGWEFAGYRALPWDHADTDVYYIRSDGANWMVAADMDTDIQDAGYADFDDVDWAPEKGWSPTGAVELIPGHVYVVWTRDNHFAKVRVRSVSGGTLVFDWAYQIDNGNPELGPRPPREAQPLSVTPGSRSLTTGS